MHRNIKQNVLIWGGSSLVAVFVTGAEAPNVSLSIENQTSCSLEMNQLFQSRVIISMPGVIQPRSTEHGQIQFDGGILSGNKQWATTHYVANCQDSHHLLALHFNIAPDPNDETDYYFHSASSPDAPFLISPSLFPTVLRGQHPLAITIIPKGEIYVHEPPTTQSTVPDDVIIAPDNDSPGGTIDGNAEA